MAAAGQADLGGDPFGLGEGDVCDEQSGDAFAFPHRGVGIVPEPVYVAGEVGQFLPQCLVEGFGFGAGAFDVFAGGGGLAQGRVPVRFQAVGDQTVVRVDREIAAFGQVGAVLGALEVGGAEPVGFGGLGGRGGR